VPIAGPEVDQLLKQHRFFTPDLIPGGVYPGIVASTPTLGVAALWLVSAELDDELVHAITAALWHPAAREALVNGHPKGKEVQLPNALRGVAIPVHPGAARYYREHGIAE
jgi:TRAP transporter TAXI family solute receptor